MDLVSIIIPTHNGSKHILKAVESALNQSYKNIEVIIVDDNGKGTIEQINTEHIIQPFLSDNRVKYIAHDININGSAARNTGFKYSRGKYITLLDDDDEYLPNKIMDQIDEFLKLDETWGMVYSGATHRAFDKSGNLLYDLLLHSVVIGSDSLMVRRSIFEQVNGFDESFKRHQDYEFTARVAAITKIKCVKSIGFIYNSQVGRNKSKSIDIAKIHRKHYIDKMLPLIKKFPVFKQKVIICSNSMEVVSIHLNDGKFIKFYKELKDFSQQWNLKIGLVVILYTICMKVLRKLNRKPLKNPTRWRS